MRIREIRIVVCLVLLSAFGCAGEPAYIPLTQDASQRIKSSNVVLVSVQHEIKADVERSNVADYTGGGLIPALIDVWVESSRSKSTEDDIKPIRDALTDFDMGKELHASIGTRLDTVPWLHVKKVEILYETKPDMMSSLLNSSSEDALILITPSYSLTSDFVALQAQSEVKVLPRADYLRAAESKDGKIKAAPLYKNMVTQITPLVIQVSDRKAAVQSGPRRAGHRSNKR